MDLKGSHDAWFEVENLWVDFHRRDRPRGQHYVPKLSEDWLCRYARIQAVKLEQRVELELVLRVRLYYYDEASIVGGDHSGQVGYKVERSVLIDIFDLERVQKHHKSVMAEFQRTLVYKVLLLQLVDEFEG